LFLKGGAIGLILNQVFVSEALEFLLAQNLAFLLEIKVHDLEGGHILALIEATEFGLQSYLHVDVVLEQIAQLKLLKYLGLA